MLVEARKNGGWTQEQIAVKLGKPQSFVAKYEGGERRLDLIELIEVARAVNLDPMTIVAEVLREGAKSDSEPVQPKA